MIDKLREHFTKLNIPASSKWNEIVKEYAEDSVFK